MEGINTPFVIDEHTAIVMTDPQNDFLSENGLGWGAFGENIQKNGTVENLRRIFEVAAAKGMLVFISPHYYYKHDHQWLFEGPIEKLMHDTGMFERRGQLTGEGFEGSGADWLDLYKPYINEGTNIGCSNSLTIVVGVCSFPNSFNKCSMVYCKLIVFCKNGSNTVIFQMLQGSFLGVCLNEMIYPFRCCSFFHNYSSFFCILT